MIKRLLQLKEIKSEARCLGNSMFIVRSRSMPKLLLRRKWRATFHLGKETPLSSREEHICKINAFLYTSLLYVHC